MGGVRLFIFTMSLLRSEYNDLAEYVIAITMILFFYEFIYFLAAGAYFGVSWAIIIGWQIAVILYFGINGATIAGLILYVILMRRLNTED